MTESVEATDDQGLSWPATLLIDPEQHVSEYLRPAGQRKQRLHLNLPLFLPRF